LVLNRIEMNFSRREEDAADGEPMATTDNSRKYSSKCLVGGWAEKQLLQAVSRKQSTSHETKYENYHFDTSDDTHNS